jgi:pimeloyl-[acyl-carrier protein] methyl ester esterase
LYDAGYFGDARLPEGHFDIAIGHSAGLTWLLQGQDVSFDRVVSIAGFTRFCRGSGFEEGWDSRVIARMQRQLVADPAAVLGDFWQTASAEGDRQDNFPRPATAFRVAAMADGLQALSNDDCREQWSRIPANHRLVIAGTDDRIVTSGHTQSCFTEDRIEWLKTDGHWLPWTFPETCAALLREMIQGP